jgi:hypothetical protein
MRLVIAEQGGSDDQSIRMDSGAMAQECGETARESGRSRSYGDG